MNVAAIPYPPQRPPAMRGQIAEAYENAVNLLRYTRTFMTTPDILSQMRDARPISKGTIRAQLNSAIADGTVMCIAQYYYVATEAYRDAMNDVYARMYALLKHEPQVVPRQRIYRPLGMTASMLNHVLAEAHRYNVTLVTTKKSQVHVGFTAAPPIPRLTTNQRLISLNTSDFNNPKSNAAAYAPRQPAIIATRRANRTRLDLRRKIIEHLSPHRPGIHHADPATRTAHMTGTDSAQHTAQVLGVTRDELMVAANELQRQGILAIATGLITRLTLDRSREYTSVRACITHRMRHISRIPQRHTARVPRAPTPLPPAAPALSTQTPAIQCKRTTKTQVAKAQVASRGHGPTPPPAAPPAHVKVTAQALKTASTSATLNIPAAQVELTAPAGLTRPQMTRPWRHPPARPTRTSHKPEVTHEPTQHHGPPARTGPSTCARPCRRIGPRACTGLHPGTGTGTPDARVRNADTLHRTRAAYASPGRYAHYASSAYALACRSGPTRARAAPADRHGHQSYAQRPGEHQARPTPGTRQRAEQRPQARTIRRHLHHSRTWASSLHARLPRP